MHRTDFGEMHCSIARAGQVVGESWTPLILRDLLLGFSRFEEIRENLGISTNILTDRLNTLVEHGLVERIPDDDRHDRHGYGLTEKGRDAISIVLAMLAWGDRWESGEAGVPTEVLHRSCGHTTHVVMQCSQCGDTLDLDDLSYHRGPGSVAGRGTALLPERLQPPID
ncbi:MAG TPA: helix-turn-helix domain-containing protein [Acidimicrobiia bacterium]|nr:helix-turn-helix domain-containing protein [Acidimicrobiia bacterium]